MKARFLLFNFDADHYFPKTDREGMTIEGKNHFSAFHC